ncbi:MAG: endonuclease III [Planctomycetaceae bacterium]|jgi:endonuclease-3|nr:endonuclease III [Planctomycetaceae bacterium]
MSPDKSLAQKIYKKLKKYFPEPKCSLEFANPLELLVATILSAQCTDIRVNIVTQNLFSKYKKVCDYVDISREELENDIKSTGFYKNKAKNIQETCRLLSEKHNGVVPSDLDALVQLPGVGRKTANVVLGTAFGKTEGVVVDTHVGRLSQRLGFTGQKTPEKIEQDLMRLFPKNEWISLSHRLITHGRKYCTAKKPNCEECPVSEICPKIGVSKKTERIIK